MNLAYKNVTNALVIFVWINYIVYLKELEKVYSLHFVLSVPFTKKVFEIRGTKFGSI